MRSQAPECRTLVAAALVAVATLTLSMPDARAAAAPPLATRPVQPYHLVDEFAVGGDGAWGDLAFDAATHRLFICRSTFVQVVDADGRKQVGALPCADGAHGIVLSPETRRGFLSTLSDTSLLVFDLDSMTVVRTLKLGTSGIGPLAYDPATRRVIVLDPGGAVSAIDATTLEVAVTRDLGVRPMGAASDGAGALYVGLPAQDAVLVLDAHTLLERARWPLESGAGPMALAYDAETHRVFAAGKGIYMAAVEPDRGRVVARVPIGGGIESLVFDAGRKVIAGMAKGGSCSSVWQESADRYTTIATVGTNSGGHSFAFDPATHRLYVVSGRVARTASATPGGRPTVGLVPGSFTVYILEL